MANEDGHLDGCFPVPELKARRAIQLCLKPLEPCTTHHNFHVIATRVYVAPIIAELDASYSAASMSHPTFYVLVMDDVPHGQLTTQVA